MMGRLDEHIAAVGKGQDASRLEAVDKIGRDMGIAAGDEPAIDVRSTQFRLQLSHAASNVLPSIGIDPWENMRSAGDDPHAVSD